MDYIATTSIDQHLIEAWDLFFKKFDHKLKNSFAIIGIESIMDTGFDADMMTPGNIFITSSGKIIKNKLNVDDCMNVLNATLRYF